MNDGLSDRHRDAIISILKANPRVERAVLFGSRAMGTFTMTSDVDIALFGDQLTLDDLGFLSERMFQLTIPQRIDLLIQATLSSYRGAKFPLLSPCVMPGQQPRRLQSLQLKKACLPRRLAPITGRE